MDIQRNSLESMDYTFLTAARHCGMWAELENSVFPQPCCSASLGKREQEAAYPTLPVMEMLTVIPWAKANTCVPSLFNLSAHLGLSLCFFTNLVNYFLFTFKANSFVLSLHLKL